jgi:hypothetical protein
MIANVSPTVLQAEETHNTLKYANRAKNIRIRAEKNVVDIAYQISQYPMIIEALKTEIQELKKQSENSVTFYENDIVDELYHETLDKIRKCYDKIKGKHMERVDIQSKLDWNEFSLQHLEQVKEDVEAAKHADQLDAMNTTLRHNLEEAKIAVERYETQLQERMDKSSNSLKAALMHRLTIEKRLSGFLIQIQVMEHQLQLATQLGQTFSVLTCELVRLFVTNSKSDEEKRMSLLAVLLGAQKSSLTGSDVSVLYDSCTDASDAESSVYQSDAERNDSAPTDDALVLAKALGPITDVSVSATPVRSRLGDSHPSSGLLSTLKKPANRKTPMTRKRQSAMSQENAAPQDMDKTPIPASRKPAAASSALRLALDAHPRESPRSIKRLKKRRDSMIPTMPQRDGSLLSISRNTISSTMGSSVARPKSFLNTTSDDQPIRRSQRNNPSRRMSMLPVPK